MRIILQIALLMVVWALPVQAEEPVGARHTLVIKEEEREYFLFTPSAASKKPRALVVALHGAAGSPQNMADTTGFSTLAEKENFLVAYPKGTGRVPTWNAGTCCGYAERTQADDVAFIRAMIDDIRKKTAVDDQRIYATGMSNGGMLAYRLACEMGDVFTAIAPVAGAMNTTECTPQGRPSLIVFHALNDKYVLYQGGPSEEGLRAMFNKTPKPDNSVQNAMEFWLKHNYCRKIPQVEQYTDYSIINYFCAENREVRLITLNSGGHSWPGTKKTWQGGDDPVMSIWATRAIWDFFHQHPPEPLF